MDQVYPAHEILQAISPPEASPSDAWAAKNAEEVEAWG